MSAPADQKTKSAHLWARDEHDWYVEPEWCSRRLFEEERFHGRIYDPACGTGRIVDAARAAGLHAEGGDIVLRREDFTFERDFLDDTRPQPFPAENIACNPPFRHAEAFVRKALACTTGKVAMLLPATWRSGDERAAWLQTTPLYRVLDLTPRPSMPPGAVLAAGEKPGGGTKDFAWYIWLQGYSGDYRGGWLRRDGGS